MSKSTVKSSQELLSLSYNPDTKYEISLDEVGRGPLFGRVYVAAVVLPKDGSFDGTNIKDSKKFSSKKKMKHVAEYIQLQSLFWDIQYVDADTIDDINILQAVFKCMHNCIHSVITKIIEIESANPDFVAKDHITIVIDGDRYKPYCLFNEATHSLEEIPSVTVLQGDSKYMAIAAASIIAKVAHDEYIFNLCNQYPLLEERYHLSKNVGYGTKQHFDGILQYGITQWHRKTFGICRTATYSPI
jgi:ribonuclease HII